MSRSEYYQQKRREKRRSRRIRNLPPEPSIISIASTSESDTDTAPERIGRKTMASSEIEMGEGLEGISQQLSKIYLHMRKRHSGLCPIILKVLFGLFCIVMFIMVAYICANLYYIKKEVAPSTVQMMDSVTMLSSQTSHQINDTLRMVGHLIPVEQLRSNILRNYEQLELALFEGAADENSDRDNQDEEYNPYSDVDDGVLKIAHLLAKIMLNADKTLEGAAETSAYTANMGEKFENLRTILLDYLVSEPLLQNNSILRNTSTMLKRALGMTEDEQARPVQHEA